MRTRSILLAVLLSATVGGCGGRAEALAADTATRSGRDGPAAARSAEPVSLPVVGQPTRDGDLILTIATTGQVQTDAEARLRAEVAGAVEEVLVRPGDVVRRGQIIARLDARPLDLAVREAEVAVAEAELRYADGLAPDSIVGRKPLSAERREYMRVTSGLAAARVRLDQRKLERERALILSPFNGVIDRVDVSVGERLTPGEAIATLVDLQHLRVEAAVLEHDLAIIRTGAVAWLSSAAAPERRSLGRVTAVLPRVDSATRAGRALVRVDGDGNVRPGMYVDVTLEASRLTRRRLVPAKAIIQRDNRPLVFVARNGRAEWVYLSIGRTNGVDTEVLRDSVTGEYPVQVGDVVITEGHITLTHDAPIRLVRHRDGSQP